MFFLPPVTDIQTLRYLRKSMSADLLEEADAEGAFDLLKASNLHPEVVTVHGKHGTYMAVRNKKNAQGEAADGGSAKGGTAGMMSKLKTSQAKKRAKNASENKTEPDSKPKTKTKTKPEVKAKPKPEAKPKPKTKPEVKAKPETGTKKQKPLDVHKILCETMGDLVGDVTFDAMAELATAEERYKYLSSSVVRHFLSDDVIRQCAEQYNPKAKPAHEQNPPDTGTKSETKPTPKPKPKPKPEAGAGSKKTAAKKKADEGAENNSKRFARPGLTKSFVQTLEHRFSKATPDAKRAFDKYAGALSDCMEKTNASHGQYSVLDDRIRIKASEDARGIQNVSGTAGSTTFHELGHLIDYRAKKAHPEIGGTGAISSDPEFIAAIRDDVKAAEQAMKDQMKADGVSKVRIKDVRLKVCIEIVKSASTADTEYGRREGAAYTSGVQDIFGGVIKGTYPGAMARHSQNYWKQGGDAYLGTETFAHMYAACSNEAESAAMEKWLPNAYRRFKELLAEVA